MAFPKFDFRKVLESLSKDNKERISLYVSSSVFTRFKAACGEKEVAVSAAVEQLMIIALESSNDDGEDKSENTLLTDTGSIIRTE